MDLSGWEKNVHLSNYSIKYMIEMTMEMEMIVFMSINSIVVGVPKFSTLIRSPNEKSIQSWHINRYGFDKMQADVQQFGKKKANNNNNHM